MENAYSPQAWHDLFVMLGGAAAALTGMLLVAVSLHVDDIMGSPDVKRRVATNFFALVRPAKKIPGCRPGRSIDFTLASISERASGVSPVTMARKSPCV